MAFNYGNRELSFSDTYIMVAGIDFGTTFSAYAFSFRSSEGDIRMNSNWGAAVGCESYKAPTCVMTKPNGEFHSFGYDAESDYSELNADQTDPETGYNLYRNFKMVLHKQGVRLSSTVTSTSGNVRPAIDIFAMALQYLKNHMLEAINKAVASPQNISLIRWVVTVPAIWTDESKRFMREAAFKAGLILSINSKKLMIALEPEAASVFCQALDSSHFIQNSSEDGATKMRAGEKIMIIDAGGGTIDITTHKLKISGDVEEVIAPSGGPWGGINIDEKFVSLLGQIFGIDFLNDFKSKQPSQWLAFQLSFEKAKKTIDPDSENKNKMSIVMPWSVATAYASFCGKGIDQVINEKANLGVSFTNGNFIISSKKCKEMFESVINLTIQHVRDLLQDPRANNLGYVLIVGGFGECKYLQKAIFEAFSGKAKILIPLSAQLAIIKGAVMYGHKPEQISSRIAKYYYGCEVRDVFIEDLHDPEKAEWVDGVKRCKNVFHCLINKNNIVESDVPYKHTLNRLEKYLTEVIFPIYTTTEDNKTYIDEPGMNKLGILTLTSPEGPLGKELELQLTFGGTEFLVEARDKSRGKEFPVNMTIDFLQD